MKFKLEKNKIRKSEEFQKIIKNGKRISNDSFIVFFIKNQTKKTAIEKKYLYCKIGISIPKRILKKSSKRNKQKRQIRSLVKITEKEKKFAKRINNYFLLIVMKEGFLRKKFEEKKKSLGFLIKNIMKICEKNFKERCSVAKC